MSDQEPTTGTAGATATSDDDPARTITFEPEVIEGSPPAAPSEDAVGYDGVLATPEPEPGYAGLLDYAAAQDHQELLRWLDEPPVVTHDGEPTLDEAQKLGIELPMRSLSMMDGETISAMSPRERHEWYRRMLGPYAAQIEVSAKAHGIPPKLLATILINELADIGFTDVVQQELPMTSGSLGIAQIQVDTAIKYNLLGPLSKAEVAHRLAVPQHSIEAAAKHIEQLLAALDANPGGPWARKFGYTPGAANVFDRVSGASALEREARTAEMIAGAYNSPDIIIAKDPLGPGKYGNARIHGENAALFAGELTAADLRPPPP